MTLPRFDAATPQLRLAQLRSAVDGRIVFTTSFGLEDQALTHMIRNADLNIDIVTIDTGRLFPETYRLWAETEERYGLRIRSVHPNPADLAALLEDWGVNGFYYSKDARHACCAIRKVAPLQQALAGASAWVTGLRADQSSTRQQLDPISIDDHHQLLKAAPLHDWTRADTALFCATNLIPVSPLHDKGFLSIGCEPCTRAVRPGEGERAGRWWWEQDDTKECGLHLQADGRLVRIKEPV